MKKVWLQKTPGFVIVWLGTSAITGEGSKMQVKGGQNEKDGRLEGSLILLLGVTDSKIHTDTS